MSRFATRAYYAADEQKFFRDTDAQILGELAKNHVFILEIEQKTAWLEQISILRRALSGQAGFTVFFEFVIPRMGRRADVVVTLGGRVAVIEFKVGSHSFDRSAIDQVEDYALDLKNFHEGSHPLEIVPILVPTGAASSEFTQLALASDGVAKPLRLCANDLGPALQRLVADAEPEFDAAAWAASGYRPTPTIVEAARVLYEHHDVKDIARSDAEAINLSRTEGVIADVIERSKAGGHKSICFVTGVPGAGKTLAGLNIATKRSDGHADEHAVFLSGNGPLVDVLREALTRDQHLRLGGSKSDAERRVMTFIQNIHAFRDEYVHTTEAPVEHVVVFDEAQRAWTRAQASKFMQSKRGVPGFDMSEPEFLLGVMNRHGDWCTVVCLIGGGQEINTGEAGLSEWMAAIRDRFPHWKVYASEQIRLPEYDLNRDAKDFLSRDQVSLRGDLHLGVSLRSFRAETLSDFVSHVLNGDLDRAKAAHVRLEKYPIVLTRDLSRARQWLRGRVRGSERSGLVASSGALRLKPEGLHVKAGIEPANWFLNDRFDVRSSLYLEDPASEFDIQGLELDWAAVCWDADLRRVGNDWACFSFKGTRWQAINDRFRRIYLKNAYRVILTRARQGMVIFVPQGDDEDPTRPKAFYDCTYAFLQSCGLRELS